MAGHMCNILSRKLLEVRKSGGNADLSFFSANAFYFVNKLLILLYLQEEYLRLTSTLFQGPFKVISKSTTVSYKFCHVIRHTLWFARTVLISCNLVLNLRGMNISRKSTKWLQWFRDTRLFFHMITSHLCWASREATNSPSHGHYMGFSYSH